MSDVLYQQHKTITPSDSVKLIRLTRIYCNSTGNIVIKDEHGTSVTYVAVVGQYLPVLAQYVMATNTTATSIIGVYQW